MIQYMRLCLFLQLVSRSVNNNSQTTINNNIFIIGYNAIVQISGYQLKHIVSIYAHTEHMKAITDLTSAKNLKRSHVSDGTNQRIHHNGYVSASSLLLIINSVISLPYGSILEKTTTAHLQQVGWLQSQYKP